MSTTTFLSVPKKDCITLYKKVLNNSDSKWKAGNHLAEASEYATAVTLQIVSIEELIKSIFILMDGKGFMLRNIKGMDTIFKNHQIRHVIAYAIFVIGIFGEDIIRFIKSIQQRPDDLIILSKMLNEDPYYLLTKHKFYIYRKIVLFTKEFEWFANAEFLRQDGLYVDYDDESNSTKKIDKKSYNEIFKRLQKVRYVGKQLIESLNASDQQAKDALKVVKKQFNDKKMKTAIESALRQGRRKPFELIKDSFSSYS